MKRILSIDIARGLVMVIMALDHTRDFLHIPALTQSPTDLSSTSPALFLTRWITYLCAPSFVFLSGVSAYISLTNGRDRDAGRRFLLSRGIWLLILEFTLVNFALWFDIHFRLLMFEVIATIGMGFILLSLLSRFSPGVLGITGWAIIFIHDLVSPAQLPDKPALQFAGSLLLRPGAFQVTPHIMFFVAYPVLPWLGILLAGFAAGRLFEKPAEERKKIFLRAGMAALGVFILLRCINSYGDPSPWSHQKSGVFTCLSFINISKYPPSLLFTLSMLGILFLVIAAAEGKNSFWSRILPVYGRVPLFYFLVHLYIIHSILLLVVLLQGYLPAQMVFGPFQNGRPAKGSGLSLPWVYGVWIGVVLIMYPLCRGYGRYKAAHRDYPWLRYL
jgi:uncharacterized membrane protein